MNILVTGANGLVGGAIYERLNADSPNNVLALTHSATDAATLHCDLSRDDLGTVLHNSDMDAIVHCAAVIPYAGVTDEWVYQQNAAMDANVVRYCAQNQCRLLYLSSVAVYKDFDERINMETSPVQADILYQRGKLETEALIQEQCPSYAIFRIPSPYGPKQAHTTVLKLFIEKALRGEPIGYYGKGSRTQNFIHVKDIAKAAEKALGSSGNEIYNIAAAKAVSMKELAELVVDVAQKDFGSVSTVQPVPKPDAQEGYRSNISIQKAREMLNWQPEIRLEDGVSDWMHCLKVSASRS